MCKRAMNCPKRNYRILPALHEEAKEGWVWIAGGQIDDRTEFLLILNPDNGRRVVCEKRRVDDYFRQYYNRRGSGCDKAPLSGDQVIVMAKVFRDRLGIERDPKDNDPVYQELHVGPASFCEKHIFAYWTHPNSVVRTSIRLALISAGLGLLGLVLGIFGLIKSCS